MFRTYCGLEISNGDRSYRISPSEDGTKAWITAESGEGAQFSAQLLFDTLDKMYRENF